MRGFATGDPDLDRLKAAVAGCKLILPSACCPGTRPPSAFRSLRMAAFALPCGAVVLIDASSNTDRSVQTWKATRSIFGTFQEAILTRVEGGDRQYAFLGPGFEWDEVDPDAWQPPGMVLGDERNRELWLSGCSGGYRGTGPHAAAYILLKEGFRLNSFSLC